MNTNNLLTEKVLTARFSALISNMQEAVLVENENRKIVLANNAFCQMFGFDMPPELMIGIDCSDAAEKSKQYFVNPEEFVRRVDEILQNKTIVIGDELELVMGIFLLRDYVPVYIDDKYLGHMWKYRNVTSQKSMMKELSDAKRKLEEKNEALSSVNENLEELVKERTLNLQEANRDLMATNEKLIQHEHELEQNLEHIKEVNDLKTRFVTLASHEFRTPLSAINSSAALISKYTKSDENDKRLKHINRIKSSVLTLTDILNDFLSLSKIEEGKVTMKKSEVDILDLCQEVTEDLEGMLKKGQVIKLENNCVSSLIKSDKKIIMNILFNILSNAIKYSDPGSDIICNISSHNSNIMLTIRDTGLGIPAEEQKHLFKRFFRASNVLHIQGTGIGLEIVKRYVDLINGNISFDSIENNGTTFKITIPKK